MCNNQRNQNNNQKNNEQRSPIQKQDERRGYRDYSHIHERVEETSSTKNPPKERK